MENRTGKRQHYLKITNHETMLMFEQMIEDWFAEDESTIKRQKNWNLSGFITGLF